MVINLHFINSFLVRNLLADSALKYPNPIYPNPKIQTYEG